MPKSNGWYQMKKPHLQIKILKLTALTGRLSQKEAISRFRCKPSTISEAFTGLKNRKLIQETNAPELEKLEKCVKGIRRERFYKLLPKGLEAFIDEQPSPEEFWITITWYCVLNPHVDKTEFNRYYDLFIDGFVEKFPLRSCFFLGGFFEELFQKWRNRIDERYYHSRSMGLGYPFYEARKALKVLECLLLNRGITVQKIVEQTELTEQDVRKTLKDYSLIHGYYPFSDYYESVYQSSRSLGITTDLLCHLLIIPIGRKIQEEKYELSLIGILLMLATASLMRQRGEGSYHIGYYNKLASNYQEKLPLIFGKWGLLKNILNFDLFPSIFDYLLSSYKPQILSLSVSNGGNKEIYDNIISATLSTINKLFVVYDEGISALQSGDYHERFLKSNHYRFIQEKLNEIEISLKYADLESFAKYMKSKKINSDSNSGLDPLTFKKLSSWKINKLLANNREENFHLEDDLHIIESALADEFTFLFYLGLLRENNHKASDYPLTTGFMRPNSKLVYPKWFLMKILKRDKEIRDTLTAWIKEASFYQKQSADKIDEIYAEIKNA